MMHLRRDSDFREIARYSGAPGQGMYMGNPMIPNNASFFQGPQAGQAYFLAGEPVMPTGVPVSYTHLTLPTICSV